jgi:hypothetical protein
MIKQVSTAKVQIFAICGRKPMSPVLLNLMLVEGLIVRSAA